MGSTVIMDAQASMSEEYLEYLEYERRRDAWRAQQEQDAFDEVSDAAARAAGAPYDSDLQDDLMNLKLRWRRVVGAEWPDRKPK